MSITEAAKQLVLREKALRRVARPDELQSP